MVCTVTGAHSSGDDWSFCQPVVGNVTSVTAETVTAADVGAAGAGDTEEEAAVGKSWTPGSVAAR